MDVLRGFIAGCASVLVASVAAAQGTPRQRAEALVAQALSSARAGDTSQALKILQQARKTDDKYVPAHFQYGIIASRSSTMGFLDIPKRSSAVDAFHRVIELEKDNAWAMLELGRLRLKMPFMRINAEEQFRKALAAAERKGDPEAIAEINFEIGQIYDRRFRTRANRYQFVGASIDMVDPYAAQYEKHYVEELLRYHVTRVPDAGEADAMTAEGYYRAALAADPGHEGSASSLATILYGWRRFQEMAAVAHNAAVRNVSSARLRLAEGLALMRMGRIRQAGEVLEQAVGLMTDRERQMIASIAPIMRASDARSFESLDAAGRTAYERTFWDVADPLYLSGTNEMRLEFLARVAYADLYFSTPELDVRGALTDRGQIVLRYGEPPTIATFAPDVTTKDDGRTQGRVTTLWWYPEDDLRFVFIGPPAMTSAIFAGDFAAYADELRYTKPVVFARLPGGLKTDSMATQIARFRGDQPLSTRLEVYAAVPAGKLAAGTGLTAAEIETAFVIKDGGRRVALDSRDTTRVEADSTIMRVRRWDQLFRPGEYAYSLEAYEQSTAHGARARGAFSIGSFPTGSLSVSDLLVGTDLENPMAEPRSRSEVRLRILPDFTLNPGQPLSIYWETYGAKPTADGQVRLNVDLTLTIMELDRPPGLHIRALGALADRLGISEEGERKVTMSYTRTSPAPADEKLHHAMTLALDNAPPAQYLLEVKMTDLESGQTAKISRVIYIRRPQQ
jgi:GWxTD domain-containing protein